MSYVIVATGEPDKRDDFDADAAGSIDEHKIYNDGYGAAENNKPLAENPWPEDSYASGVWEDGWYDYDMNER